MRCLHFHLLCCVGFILFCFSVCHISAEAPARPKIVFNSTRDGNTEIYMMDTDGKQQVRLTQRPDGTEIVFPKAGLVERPTPLIIINLRTRHQEILQPEPQLHMFRPDWSTDGTTIAFSHVEKLGGKGPIAGTLYTVSRDGSNLREIIPEKEPISQHPVWSPPGDELAYNKKIDENWQILKIDLTSRQSVQLTNRGINVYPDWFDPAFALPVSPKPRLLTTVWAKMKISN